MKNKAEEKGLDEVKADEKAKMNKQNEQAK